MKFSQLLSSQIIPQWKQFYIDYATLKIYLTIIQKIVQLSVKLNQQEYQNNQIQIISSNHPNHCLEVTHEKNNSIAFEKHHQLKGLLEQANQKFCSRLHLQIRLSILFIKMKKIELQQKFTYYRSIEQEMHPYIKNHPNLILQYLSLIQFLYIQNVYVSRFQEITIQSQRKILKKHKKYARKFCYTPISEAQLLRRYIKASKIFTDEIQDHYVKCTNTNSKSSRLFLRQICKLYPISVNTYFIFGLWLGAASILLIFLLSLLIQFGLSIDSDPAFNRDFPTWRGPALFIFFIWIHGLNIRAYEKYYINHRLILKFHDHHYSISTDMFKTAAFFTTIYFVTFFLYVTIISGLIQSALPSYYLVLFTWVSLIVYYFLPLPVFNWKGRKYILIKLIEAIFSPYRGVEFPHILITAQLLSLVIPIKDLVYTFCYFSQLHLQNPNEKNVCSDFSRPYIIFTVATFTLSIRILQCFREIYNAGHIFCLSFINGLKFALILATVIISFIYKVQQEKVFYGWIVFASISSVFAFLWDIKMDWSLMTCDSQSGILRKTLSYPIILYYIMIASNLLLRISWMLTLSPNIAKIFKSPQLFLFLTSILEIVRKGIWNILRVEKEHLINCGNFEAMPSTLELESILLTKLKLVSEKKIEDQSQLVGITIAKQRQSMQMVNTLQNMELIQEGNNNSEKNKKLKKEFLQLLQEFIKQKNFLIRQTVQYEKIVIPKLQQLQYYCFNGKEQKFRYN